MSHSPVPVRAEPPTPISANEAAYPTRFGWLLRLFLCFVIAVLLFRSFSVLYPWRKWADQLDVRRYPGTGFPSRAEQRKILDSEEGGQAALRERWFESLDSHWLFSRPWPGPNDRPQLTKRLDFLKWYLVYANSRLLWIENAIGFDQEWPMYSPSVATEATIPRTRLLYADGTERIVRVRADPEDLTRFFRTALYKTTEYELMISNDPAYQDEANAFCNMLALRHPTTETGSEIVEVRVFNVTYLFTPPGEDPGEWLKNQTGPPPNQISPDFYSYDVRSRSGRFLSKK